MQIATQIKSAFIFLCCRCSLATKVAVDLGHKWTAAAGLPNQSDSAGSGSPTVHGGVFESASVKMESSQLEIFGIGFSPCRVDVARKTATGEYQKMGLTFSALAGAFLVGVAGAKWITNEVDKKLLKESVKVAGTTGKMTEEECEKLVEGSALTVLDRVERASQAVKAA
jgi:hypothetical protein